MSKFFSSEGKLFQTIGPEYVMLCLNISLLGRGVVKFEDTDDRKRGKFSLTALRLNISLIYSGVSDLYTLNMNLDFRKNNLS